MFLVERNRKDATVGGASLEKDIMGRPFTPAS